MSLIGFILTIVLYIVNTILLFIPYLLFRVILLDLRWGYYSLFNRINPCYKTNIRKTRLIALMAKVDAPRHDLKALFSYTLILKKLNFLKVQKKDAPSLVGASHILVYNCNYALFIVKH